MAYVGEDVAIRMPSATSIKSFADADVLGKGRGETFDVPVSAQFPGGQIDGWVRVAKGSDGTWATQGLGFTAEQSAYVAESVQCVLESRRPSRALRDAGDILERRRQRAAELGAPVTPITSTWIKGAGYDKVTGTMVITTNTKSGPQAPMATTSRSPRSEASPLRRPPVAPSTRSFEARPRRSPSRTVRSAATSMRPPSTAAA